MTENPTLRPARRADAAALARLADMAADGLPAWWRARIAPGRDPHETGAERAARDEGAFSWRNADVAGAAGGVVGSVIGCPLDARAAPTADAPAAFAPVEALEVEAGACFYVNFLGVAAGWRGRGIGPSLLAAAAAARARAAGRDRLALVASDANHGARRICAREGFAETAARPIVRDGWDHHGTTWLLLTRPVPAA